MMNHRMRFEGLGKEKFLTSVKMKSLSPNWDEQAEL